MESGELADSLSLLGSVLHIEVVKSSMGVVNLRAAVDVSLVKLALRVGLAGSSPDSLGAEVQGENSSE